MDYSNMDDSILNVETDLSNLDYKSAKEYVYTIIITLKETQKQKKDTSEELKKWHNRVELAKQHSRTDLETKASAKIDELNQKFQNLQSEETLLKQKVETLQKELKRIKDMPELSMDPDQLLAEVEVMIDEPDSTQQEFDELSAESMLKELKKNMGQQGKE